MASRTPIAGASAAALRRPTLSAAASSSCAASAAASRAFSTTPSLGSRIIRRPRRPYSFTQLVQLSDGSTFTMRTSSPHAMYKSTKDTRNHLLWNPSEKTLRNLEVDEAGKLAAFRDRFGRGWDAASRDAAEDGADGKSKEQSGDPLGDLISGYSRPEDIPPPDKVYTPNKKK